MGQYSLDFRSKFDKLEGINKILSSGAVFVNFANRLANENV